MESPAQPKVAGSVLISLQRFVNEAHGAGAFQKLVERLPPAQRPEFSGVFSTLHWYPTPGTFALMDAGRDVFGPHDFHERYGAASANDQINTLYRFVLRLTSPTWMITRGMAMWRRFHDSGVWEVSGKDRTMKGTLRDFALVHAPYCRVVVGWLGQAFRITGATEGRVWHPECRATGKSECVFIGRW